MRRFALSILLITSAPASTFAEPARGGAPAPLAAPSPDRPVAFAVNTPLAWKASLAASVWVGWEQQHAIRVNLARYRAPLLSFIAGWLNDPSDADFGHTTDLGIGWVHHPRGVLRGPSLESGVLCRLRRTRDRINVDDVAAQERFTNTYAARFLGGYTWRPSHRLLVSAALGMSFGYERGRERTPGGPGGMAMDARVSRLDAAVEAYLRFGLMLGR